MQLFAQMTLFDNIIYINLKEIQTINNFAFGIYINKKIWINTDQLYTNSKMGGMARLDDFLHSRLDIPVIGSMFNSYKTFKHDFPESNVHTWGKQIIL